VDIGIIKAQLAANVTGIASHIGFDLKSVGYAKNKARRSLRCYVAHQFGQSHGDCRKREK